MKRRLMRQLMAWKDSPARQPLLVRGARQIGKSYLVDAFGQQCFDSILTVNFEKQKHLIDCFVTLEPKEILQAIELSTGQSVVAGHTLLFLDEIQECPNAILALRYFFEEMPELHVIGAGSLLEFALSAEDFSMPVGRVQYLYLYPMTFSEMLLALGEDKLHDYLESIALDTVIPIAVHAKLLKLLRTYYLLGGMPRVVSLYEQTGSFQHCRQVQVDLLNTYHDDFAKYATKVQQKYCERIFAKVPALIAKHFRYTDIDPDMDYRGLKLALNLLKKAGIVTPIYYSNAKGVPLSATRVDKFFKLLFLDLGLVEAAGRVEPELILRDDLMQLNRGDLTEQFVGQHLLTLEESYVPAELYYWQRDVKNSSAEIDYVMSVSNQIVPIEVKSGSSGRLKSLHIFMDSMQSQVGVKLSTAELDTSQPIWSVPLYLVEQLPRMLGLRFSVDI